MQHAFLTDNYNELLQFGSMDLEVHLTERHCARFRLTKFGWYGITCDGYSLCAGWEKVAAVMENELDLDTVEARLYWGEYLVAPYLDHQSGGSAAAHVKEALEAVFRLADVIRSDESAASFARMVLDGINFSKRQ